jgi:enolase
VRLSLGGCFGLGDVPAGASKGEDEARTVPVAEAIEQINAQILPMLRQQGQDLSTHAGLVALEEGLIEQAGPNCSRLGANATLPVSRALWQLAAALRKMTLAAYIRRVEPRLAGERRVLFFMNIFNGGLHALRPQDGEVLGRDRIAIQEIMVVPMRAATYREALEVGERIDAALKARLLAAYGASALSRADEAGFSVRGLGDSPTALAHVFAAIEAAGLQPGTDVKLALDVAASSFYQEASKTYAFDGKDLTTDQLIAVWQQLAERYAGQLLSIEDGLAENDWAGWTKLSAGLKQSGVLTIGDDLFVTQLPRLRRGIAASAAHAILIKVNQNGTVYGTLQVMHLAQQQAMQCVVSHRSGETLDASISDLAFATGALGLKTGDPQPVGDFPDPKTWVRRAKYLRMIALEEGTTD